MKEADIQTVNAMTVEKLIECIRSAKPDSKDKMRASDILKKKTFKCEQARLAQQQLCKITDTAKFYRRAKAFLEAGIDCSLGGTIFYKCNTVDVRNYMQCVQRVGDSNRKIDSILDVLDG